jgi:hypothetical protein
MKPKTDTLTMDFVDLTVRLSGATEHLEFASRSALEDFATYVYRRGAALGWQAGQYQLTTTGIVTDDKEIVRDEAGHIVGMRSRRKVAPKAAA